jgi:hypothetical protein
VVFGHLALLVTSHQKTLKNFCFEGAGIGLAWLKHGSPIIAARA